VELEFRDVGFCEGGKLENSEKNLWSNALEPTTNLKHTWYQAGIRPRPHW